MSPTQYELAYGDPVEIIADVNKNFNYTAAEVVKGQKIKIFASEKMHWRGECFLAAGTWIPISQTKLHFKANKNSLIMFRSYAKKDVLKLKTEVHCFGYLLALADTKIIF